MLRALVLSSFVAACAAGTVEVSEVSPPRRAYKPGQSIAEARICSCHECFERTCCDGDGEAEHQAEAELGMTLAACGRCVRRVWTVRGEDSCAALAGQGCCPGTVSD